MLDKTLEPIAIFAGRGILPKMLIENCEKNNRKFLLFLLDGEKYEIDYSAFNPITVPYGAIEKFLKILTGVFIFSGKNLVLFPFLINEIPLSSPIHNLFFESSNIVLG